MQSSNNALIGSYSSMDALWQKIGKPIGWQWPPTGTPQWGLRSSPPAFSVALLSQASQATLSQTGTRSTSVSTFSTARDSSPKSKRLGSSVATTPAKQMTLSPSKLSGRMQSRLLRLLPSLQDSTDTAWPRLTTTHCLLAQGCGVKLWYSVDPIFDLPNFMLSTITLISIQLVINMYVDTLKFNNKNLLYQICVFDLNLTIKKLKT
jgi:hypothetical protein